MKLRPIWLISVLFLAGSLAVAGSSQANTYEWQTVGGGNWTTTINWLPNGIPGLNDQATINPAAIAPVTAYDRSINTLTVGSHVTLTVTTSTEVNQGLNFYRYYSASTGFISPTLTNYGTVQVTSPSGFYTAGIYVQNSANGSGPFTLTSSAEHPGNITLMGPNSRLDTSSYNTGDRTLYNGLYHTIQGAGTVQTGGGTLNNSGQIIANLGTLTLGGDTSILNNYGTLAAAAKTTGPDNILTITNQVRSMNDTNQINPNGGLVRVWNLYGDTYAVNLGAGQVEFYDPGSYYPYLYGKIKLAHDTVLNITATWAYLDKAGSTASNITNNGIINLPAGGTLNAPTGTTLTGSGRLVLGGTNALYGTFMNDVNHTIEGSGTLGYSGQTPIITNNGKIIANINTLLVVQPIDMALNGTGSVKADGGKLDIQNHLTTKDLTLTSKAGTGLNVVKPNSWTPAPIVNVSGDFLYSLNDPSKWNWGTGTTLKMSGPGPEWHYLEAGGSGFSLRTLDISGNIALVDWYDNTPGSGEEALYVDSLIWGGSTLNLNGLSLYVNGVEVFAGAYDGRVINELLPNPNVPLPPTVWLLGSGLLGLAGLRRKFKK
jgi:hypothetical protein